MSLKARQILDRVCAWPREVVDELEARRTGVYGMTAEEEAAIREGLAEFERGEWASEEVMKAFWACCGV